MPTRTLEPDPVDTIERFAELSAEQDDPFADQDDVLRAAGLDEDAWEAIEKRWMLRLSSGGADVEELSGRFGRTYSETRQRLALGAATEPVPDTLPSGGWSATPPSPYFSHQPALPSQVAAPVASGDLGRSES